MLIGQCNVIELLDVEHKTNLMKSHINLVTGTKHANITTTCIKANYSSVTMETDKILDPNDTVYKRWSCHSGHKLLCNCVEPFSPHQWTPDLPQRQDTCSLVEYFGHLYNDDRGDILEIISNVESPIPKRDPPDQMILLQRYW